MVGAFKAHPLKDIGTALDIPALHDDPRFATHALQVQNKPALQSIFKERFRGHPTSYWIARLEEQDLLCAPVKTLGEALEDEQTAINGMILETHNRVEKVRVVGSPVHLDDAPVTVRIPPAELGQHTAEVMAELGLSRTDEGRLMPIRFELSDHVARVTIDRPEVMNAVDAASEREMQRHLDGDRGRAGRCARSC